MLVDVTTQAPTGPMQQILDSIGSERDQGHPGTGLYIVGHWNFEMLIGEPHEKYPELPGVLDAYGVCDSPEQWAKVYAHVVNDQDRRFVVSFVKLEKRNEASDGGWRWHKWGPYIGEQEPQCEYLYDEPKNRGRLYLSRLRAEK